MSLWSIVARELLHDSVSRDEVSHNLNFYVASHFVPHTTGWTPLTSGGLTIEAPEARASGPAPSGGPELDGVKILEPLFTSLAVCGSGMVCYTVFTLFLTSRLA